MDVLTSFVFLLLFISSLVLLAESATRRCSNLPPGPWRLPVIGNLHQLGAKTHRSLHKLAQTHGDIMCLQLGQLTTIIISSPSAARQVLQKQDQAFANRSLVDAIRCAGHHEKSVVFLPLSPKWRQLRKICNSWIFSSQRIHASERLREQKLHELVTELRGSSSRGAVVWIGEVTFRASLNLMSNIFLSTDLDEPNSGKSLEFKKSFMSLLELVGKPNLTDFFPWLAIVDPQRIRARVRRLFVEILSFMDSIIDQRMAERQQPGRNEGQDRDVLDTLLNMAEDDHEDLTRIDIKHLLLDLFVAATDTTSGTLEWAMSELMRNPEAMARAKAELDGVIGRGEQVKDSDVPRLPYLQAIVKETLRLHPVFPFLLPRKTARDEELCGYKIPKGAQVLVNAWAIGRDRGAWGDDPDGFRPERFLGSDVDFRGGSFELIPFGSGRRICVGMPLAGRMLHLTLGSLVNCFDWKLEANGEEAEDIDMGEVFGLTLQRAKPLRAVPVAV
uniref:Cytochrome P450 n=1 Tax=Kalanchoe fedtschenkoi TaxID=63787 RepID=A0A7N0U2W1_KALFE